MEPYDQTQVTTPRGAPAVVLSRPGTSDLSVAGATMRLWGKLEDEYHLATLHVSGTFVDVGAHIGSVTLAVLLDNPEVRAICVEPLAENIEVIETTMATNGVAERVTVLQAAMGPGKSADIAYDYDETDYLRTNRYIGGIERTAPTHMQTVTVPTVSLAKLVAMAGGSVDVMKLDCEGCEWHALRSTAVRHIRTIIGEWHGHAVHPHTEGAIRLREIIGKTHDVEVIDDLGGTGVFRAVRR